MKLLFVEEKTDWGSLHISWIQNKIEELTNQQMAQPIFSSFPTDMIISIILLLHLHSPNNQIIKNHDQPSDYAIFTQIIQQNEFIAELQCLLLCF